MRILLVEDDYLQSSWVEEKLRAAFSHCEVTPIPTESAFRSRFEEIGLASYDVVVMDVMLRWADPAPNMPVPPSEIEEAGFYHAGIRCKELLAKDPRTQDIPVILYTVLEKKDLPEGVDYLSKESDCESLIQWICHRVHRN